MSGRGWTVALVLLPALGCGAGPARRANGECTEAWRTYSVDTADRTPDLTRQVVLDPEGTPHVVYFDDDFDDVVDATLVDGTWQREPLGIGRFDFGAIAFDPDGLAHTSYVTMDRAELWYVRDALGDWTAERVSADGPFGASEVVVGDGASRIVYEEGNPGETILGIATKTGTEWTSETIDSGCIQPVSSRVDVEGDVHVLYSKQEGCLLDHTRLRYATSSSGTWVSEGFGADVDSSSTAGLFALTANGTPVVALIYLGCMYPECLWSSTGNTVHLATRETGVGDGRFACVRTVGPRGAVEEVADRPRRQHVPGP